MTLINASHSKGRKVHGSRRSPIINKQRTNRLPTFPDAAVVAANARAARADARNRTNQEVMSLVVRPKAQVVWTEENGRRVAAVVRPPAIMQIIKLTTTTTTHHD